MSILRIRLLRRASATALAAGLFAGAGLLLPPAATAATNLVPNPSVESGTSTTPSRWAPDRWGTNSATFTYVTSGGHTGSRSLAVTMTQRTSGDAKWVHDPVAVAPGTRYTFSDYYVADVTTELDLEYTTTSGATTVEYVGSIPAASTWRQYTATFTTPPDAAKLVVYHIIYSVGSLRTDDYSLTATGAPPPPPAGRGFASITLDDGRASQYANAKPALDARGLKATFYVIGQALTWGSGYMTGAQVRAVAAAGHEIGNHTWDHANLTGLSSSRIAAEFTDAQAALRGNAGVTPTTCAYPYGAHNATVRGVAGQYFTTCRSTDGGVNRAGDLPALALRTYYVHTTTTAAQIRAVADQARSDGSWVVFVYHGVGTVTSADDVSAGLFGAHLDQITASGVTVATVTQAYRALTGG